MSTGSTRIDPAQPPYPAHVQQAFDRIMPSGVPPLTLFRTVARDSRLMERFFGATLLDRGHLTLRQRELTILRVCANNDSEYEWGVHVSGFSVKAGFTPEQVAATRAPTSEATCWTAPDRLLIRLCDTLHQSCDIPDALWRELRATFSEDAVLELLMLNGLYRMVSILTVGLRMPLEPWAATFAT
jgi:alkylhydroperoxidase family enzyme